MTSPQSKTNPVSDPSQPGTVPLMGLALLQTALFILPMIVLGQSIGWPASLRLSAADALPLIAREALAVQIGYWAYLLASLAFIPFALAVRRFAVARGADGLVNDTMAGLGIAVAIFKMLGIVRWLVAMPTLAVLHAGQLDPARRAAIEISYTVLNGYAGAAGELLGVQLVSGLWLVLAGFVLNRLGMRWTAASAGLIGALFVATCLRTVLPGAAGLQSVAVPLALLWFPTFAVAVWRRR
ncbi:MAG: hypothetical protein NTZ14_16785 [Hyphomicrobiales bacterium]|nr:hypothetical protein [Hyphomicrobiales bacterium]